MDSNTSVSPTTIGAKPAESEGVAAPQPPADTRPKIPAWSRPRSNETSLLSEAAAIVQGMGNKVFMTWLDDKGREEIHLTFCDLWYSAGALGLKMLHSWGVTRGDRVLLCYMPGPEFFCAFWACLRTGIVAVPVYPPDLGKLTVALEKLALVRAACDAGLCLCDGTVDKLRFISRLIYHWPDGLAWQVTDEIHGSATGGTNDEVPLLDVANPEGSVAFLQFTSGSTGDPKGVMITHASLWHNANEIILGGLLHAWKVGLAPGTRPHVVTWLPQYHDMGLILMHVAPFVGGFRSVNFSPIAFLQDPLLWLRTASRYKVHLLASPDFGYSLVTRRYLDLVPAERPMLDLTSVVLCGSGAERVRQETFAAFDATFQMCGLSAMKAPAYGLAESVVAVSNCLAKGLVTSRARPSLVCCGRGNEFGLLIKIVNPETHEKLPDGTPGEIWVASDSVALGYWGKAEQSKETFRARLASDDGSGPTFLRTGDEGFLEDGGLYICGRIKDLVIVNGLNYYPDDIEIATHRAAPDSVRLGCIASFAVDAGVKEELVIVFELRPNVADVSEVIGAIRTAVTNETGLRPARLVAIKERSIPKTTSGKIRRRATREALLEGALPIVHDTRPSQVQQPETLGSRSLPAWDWWCGPCCTDETDGSAKRDGKEAVEEGVVAHRLLAQQAATSETRPHHPAARDPMHEDGPSGDSAEPPHQPAQRLSAMECVHTALSKVIGDESAAGLTADTVLAYLGLDSGQRSQLVFELNRLRPEHVGDVLRLASVLQMQTAGELAAYLDIVWADPAAAALPAHAMQEQTLSPPENTGTGSAQAPVRKGPLRREFVRTLPQYEEVKLPFFFTLTVQTVGLLLPLLVLALSARAVWILAVLIYDLGGLRLAACALPLLHLVSALSMCTLIGSLRLLLFPRGLEPGRYRLHCWVHLRCWLLNCALMFPNIVLGPYTDTPLYNLLLVVLGAKIARGVRMGAVASFSSQLLSVDAGSTIEGFVACHAYVDGHLILARVVLGKGAEIESRTYINCGATVEDGAKLREFSVLPMGWRAPSGATSCGNPAEPQTAAPLPGLPPAPNTSPDWLKLLFMLFVYPYWWGTLVSVLFFTFAAVRARCDKLFGEDALLSWFPSASIGASAMGSAALFGYVVLKWTLVQRMRPGPVSPSMQVRTRVLHMFWSTAENYCLLLPEWAFQLAMWLLGAATSKDVFWTALSMTRALKCADLLRVGHGCFFGGDSDFSYESTAGGQPAWNRVEMPNASYLGTTCVAGVGSSLGEGGGLGAYSYLAPGTCIPPGHVFLGNPANLVSVIPASTNTNFPEIQSWPGYLLHMVLIKSLVRALAVQPTIIVATLYFWGIGFYADWLQPNARAREGQQLVPLVAIVCAGIPSFLAGVFLMITFAYISGVRWSARSKTEMRASIHSVMGYRWVFELLNWKMFNTWWLHPLCGSPWISWVLRALGATVGARVHIAHLASVYEPWFIELGDGVTTNFSTCLSPHSIEMGGRLSLRRLQIDNGATLMEDAAVHGGTRCPPGTLIGALSRPFVGEVLEECREYNSSPLILALPTSDGSVC